LLGKLQVGRGKKGVLTRGGKKKNLSQLVGGRIPSSGSCRLRTSPFDREKTIDKKEEGKKKRKKLAAEKESMLK